MPKPDDTAEVTVDGIGARGDGLASLDGAPLYVPFALPGDVLVVRLAERRGQGFVCEVVEAKRRGPDRAEPPCPHYGVCGGCALQHVADARYAAWKRDLVREALERRGFHDNLVAPLRRTPHGTRRRATFSVRRDRGGVRLGFSGRASRNVVNLDVCPVLAPALVAILAPLRDLYGSLLSTGNRAAVAVTLCDAGLDVIAGLPRKPGRKTLERLAAFAETCDLARMSWRTSDDGEPEPAAVRRPPRMMFSGVPVDLPPGAFLQPSAEGEAALIAGVAAAAEGAQRIADLYAGCGAFSFALVAGARVQAFEGDAPMVDAMRRAARGAGLEGRVTVERRDLERRPLLADELARFDAVVFDPPRAGAKRQSEALAASTVHTVIAVSCNPSTFARDARILADGGYTLEHVVPVDQFLWSHHVELVAVFRRA